MGRGGATLKIGGAGAGRGQSQNLWGRGGAGPRKIEWGGAGPISKLVGPGRGGATSKEGGAGAGPLEICNMDNNIYLNYLIRIIFILVSHFLCAYHLNWFLTFPDIISYKIGNMSFWLCTVQYAY